MFQRLPKPLEITLFVVMALICATFVLVSPKRDSALFFASVPLFLVSAMMGFRRTEMQAESIKMNTPPEQIEDTVV
jgi:hypothetical protein